MTTLDRLKALIGDACGIPAADVQDDANLGARVNLLVDGVQYLDLDSLDRLELAMTIEEHFHIEIPDKDVEDEKLSTPAALAAYIDEKQTAADIASAGVPPIDTAVDTVDATPDPLPFAWRKKPVTIQAVCFRGIVDGMATFSHDTLPDWLAEAFGGPEGSAGSAWVEAPFADDKPMLVIGTLEGQHAASPGDWIIRGVKGEIYPCKPDVFAATYEPADAAEPPITRDEVLRRGCEEGEGMALDVIAKLGWPTEGEPMGRKPTHQLVPINGLGDPI